MCQRIVVEQLVVEQRLILCVAQFHSRCKLSRIQPGHHKGEYQEYQLAAFDVPSLAGERVDRHDCKLLQWLGLEIAETHLAHRS